MNGYLVYLNWEIRNSWVRNQDASFCPYRYSSEQQRFQPRKGDSVWVVACPRWRGEMRLPPTLVAHLVLQEDVIDLDNAKSVEPDDQLFREFGRFLAKGDSERSHYFPVNNFYPTLMSLDFDSQHPIRTCPQCRQDEMAHADKPSLYAHIPSHLQTVRRLTMVDVQKLERYAQELQRQRSFFLSYRRRDASELVKTFAAELRQHDALYWLDREMVRYDAPSTAEWLPEPSLQQILANAVRQAYVFVAFVSTDYLQSNWIKRELEYADEFSRTAHLRYRIAIGLEGRPDNLAGKWQWHDLSQTSDHQDAVRELARTLLSQMKN